MYHSNQYGQLDNLTAVVDGFKEYGLGKKDNKYPLLSITNVNVQNGIKKMQKVENFTHAVGGIQKIMTDLHLWRPDIR